MSQPKYSTVAYPSLQAKIRAFNLYQTVSILYHMGRISTTSKFDNPTLGREATVKTVGDDGREETKSEWKIYLSYPDNRRLYEFRSAMLKAKEQVRLDSFWKEHPMNTIPWHPSITKPIPGVEDKYQPCNYLNGGTPRAVDSDNVTSSYFADDPEFTGQPAPTMTPTEVPGVKRKQFEVPRVDSSHFESSPGINSIPIPASTPAPAVHPPPAPSDPDILNNKELTGAMMSFLTELKEVKAANALIMQQLGELVCAQPPRNKRPKPIVVEEEVEEVHDSRADAADQPKRFPASSTSASSHVPRSDH